jgi:hypothetical protein
MSMLQYRQFILIPLLYQMVREDTNHGGMNAKKINETSAEVRVFTNLNLKSVIKVSINKIVIALVRVGVRERVPFTLSNAYDVE